MAFSEVEGLGSRMVTLVGDLGSKPSGLKLFSEVGDLGTFSSSE